MSRLSKGGVWLLALAGLTLSCAPKKDLPTKDLEVEYSRCWAVYFPGPVCAPWPDRQLNFWVKVDPGTDVEIQAGDQLLAAEEVEENSGGRLYRKVSIPAQASMLTVSLLLPDGSQGQWSLKLAEPEQPAWWGMIDRQRLLQLLKSASRREQGFVLRSLAELARLEGNDEERESYFQQGITADRAEGRLSGEIEKSAWLAGLYVDQGRFSKARETLAALQLPPKAPSESKFLVAYYQGVLAESVGDFRLAFAKLREAAGLARKVQRTDYRLMAEQVLASLLQDLGRSGEAEERFDTLLKTAVLDKCDRADLLTNWAWSLFLKREAEEEAKAPTPMFEQALAIYEGNDCATPEKLLNARLNLALARQQAGRLREARQTLEQARVPVSRLTPEQRLWWHDLEGRAAIAENHPELALRLYQELDEMAREARSSEGRFRASVGQAHAYLALNRRTAALEALAEANLRVDEQMLHVPAHEGRDTLIAQREAITRLHLSLLLDSGERRKAFDLARRARSRLLRRLSVRDLLAELNPERRQEWIEALERYREVREDIDREAGEEWNLPGDRLARARANRTERLQETQNALDRALADLGISESDAGSLAPLRPGEVVLIYHPLPQGWVGFAADERGIEVSTFDLPARETPAAPELARLLLEPFHSALERAERVRVLPSGRLRSVDFHALPFGGEPLLARRVVVYGLDLAPRPTPLEAGPSRVLLVADPQQNLLAAQEEAGRVAAAVRPWGSGWALARLEGSAARADAVRKALPGSDLFHYAGHGLFTGFAGWGSQLPLVDGSLTLSDVLALQRVPAWVVLSSCDAGRSSEEAPGEGIGLANAFLLAGSRAVIAATRKVPDAAARTLMTELYQGWQPGLDLPRHFQRAQQACLRRHPAGDCASFRLLEP